MQLSKSDAIACRRWLRLLRLHTVTESNQLLRASAHYADISLANYAYALQLLRTCKLVSSYGNNEGLDEGLLCRSDDALAVDFLERLVISFEPSWLWLQDEEQFDPVDPPLDLLQLVEVLEIPEQAGVLAARQAARKVDLAARAAFGAAGERAVIDYIAHYFPRAVIEHVSQNDDSRGYDIRVELGRDVRNLEVKAVSSSRPRRIYLSRHEFDIAHLDAAWRLVIVQLDDEGSTVSVGTVLTSYLRAQAPADVSSMTRWESLKYRLPATVVNPGLDLQDIID